MKLTEGKRATDRREASQPLLQSQNTRATETLTYVVPPSKLWCATHPLKMTPRQALHRLLQDIKGELSLEKDFYI